MGFVQDIARHVLTDRLYGSMRGESQSWVMRCPCGAETSVWEMGGIRWKAAGEPRRMGRCGACRRVFWGQVYQQRVNGQCETMNQPHRAPIELDQTAVVLLWIDGVGCWMAFPAARVTIGGPVEPGSSQTAADLCVLANLRRQHGTIERTGEAYRLTTADGDEATDLTDGREFTLGGRLRMRFRLPSVLSQTAALVPSGEPWPRMFAGPRTPASVDGVVLMEEVCLLGPGGDAHVPCRDWGETVILFRRNGQLWCRSQGSIDIDGQQNTNGRVLTNGSLVSGDGWRFRVEAVPRNIT